MNDKDHTTHGVWINGELVEFDEVLSHDGPKLLANKERSTVLSFYNENEEQEFWFCTIGSDKSFQEYTEAKISLLEFMQNGTVLTGVMPFSNIEYSLENMTELEDLDACSFTPSQNSKLDSSIFDRL